jgi:hypothetical protein
MRNRAVAGIVFVLASCAPFGAMLPGKIYSQSGEVLDFEIEVARRSGKVKAFNPRTGETFNGTYVGLLETISTTSQGNVSMIGGRRPAFVSGASSSVSGSNLANAEAFLQGDKGSMITCAMVIEAGVSPHGIGDCRSQSGTIYRLQF